MTQAIASLVQSRGFSRAIFALILLAALVVGLETYPSIMAAYGPVILAVDWAILILFAVEAVLKMAQHGRRWYRYFHDPWNVFDFTIVAICFMPLGGHFAAVLRLARVLRALRLVSALPRLQLLVSALLKSIPSMGYVGLLLLLMFYIYAVMGIALFRDNDPVHFGNLKLALLTLFRVVTLEDWTDVMYIQMFGSDVFRIDNPVAEPTNPTAMPVVGALYFLTFILFGTMIMLNLFIGVIINSMHEAQAEEQARREDAAAAATPEQDLEAIEDQLATLQARLRTVRHRLGH